MGAVYHDGLLLFFGHFSNHDGGLFRDGSLRWRRITAISTENREIVWSRPLNYLRRPLIVGDAIIIEPRGCDVRTGEVKMRSHPITGEQVPWEFLRPGHSCSITSASPNAIFYRSYCHAIYDLVEDRGLTLFGGIRPGCWLSPIAANGLLLSPEASSGCTCSFPLRATFVMTHKNPKRAREWTVFITHGAMTPAKHFTVNFGAPGDMKDDEGILWFGYPRPRTGYGVKFGLNEEILQGMGYFCQDFKGARVERSDRPWLFTSGCLGLLRCEVPLINDTLGEEPGVYTVRLGFMAPSGDRKGERVFEAKLQDDVVLKDFDILKAAGAPDKAVIKEFKGIKVKDNLTVELVPKTPDPMITQAPIINFIEVIREDVVKISGVSEAVEPLEKSDAEAKLEAAKAELGKKDYEKALEIYHNVFDAAPSLNFQLQALEGMAEIGSSKSLSRIARYCVEPSSILWNYKGPEPELRSSAINAYVAIADNIAEVDERKANEMLDYAFTTSGGLDIRQQLLSRVGFITNWRLIGPFPWDSGENTLDKVFVDEPNVDLSKSYQVGDSVMKWERYESKEEMIDLDNMLTPNTNVAVYAYAEVVLPKEQELLLKIGSDDGFKCWFNDKEIGSYGGDRSWTLDEDILKVEGRKGTNTVLLKISQGGGDWGFSARLTDTNNNPIR